MMHQQGPRAPARKCVGAAPAFTFSASLFDPLDNRQRGARRLFAGFTFSQLLVAGPVADWYKSTTPGARETFFDRVQQYRPFPGAGHHRELYKHRELLIGPLERFGN